MNNSYRRLGSKSLYLSPLLTDEDSINTYTKWYNDNNINFGVNMHDKVVDHNYVKNMIEHMPANKLNFSILENTKNTLIGMCTLTILDNISCEVSILIGDSAFRGRHLGREVLLTLCKFCFEELRMHRIRAEFCENNKAATKCAAVCGFDNVGTCSDSLFHAGVFLNTVIYELLEKAWWSTVSSNNYRSIMYDMQ